MSLDDVLTQLQTAALAIKHDGHSLTQQDWRDVIAITEMLRAEAGVFPGGEAIWSSED